MPKALTRYVVPLVLCLSLGLAPFVPEPHIVGKLRWVAGGAVGMGAIDWFDLVLHGFPWVLFAGLLVFDGVRAVLGRGAQPTDGADGGADAD